MTDSDTSYQLSLPPFYPDPWPTDDDLIALARQVLDTDIRWSEVIAEFKASHHIEAGQWVAN